MMIYRIKNFQQKLPMKKFSCVLLVMTLLYIGLTSALDNAFVHSGTTSKRAKRQWIHPGYFGYGGYGGYGGFVPGYGNNYGGLRIGWISRHDIWA
uniref:Uncharacterized protein n=1 Tax=Ascaris lumbricoides TaxID=6252 RepID=A0A0M3HW94_ASCLU